MQGTSIRVRNYKCFKDETGFDSIRRVNLVIGRNNSGKSSLLDIIEKVASNTYEFEEATWRYGETPQIVFESIIPEDSVRRSFPSNVGGGQYIPNNHRDYGNLFIGRNIKWSKTGGRNNSAILIDCHDLDVNPPLAGSGEYATILPENMPIPFQGKSFRRLLAERDILPENVHTNNPSIQTNGFGITNTIQCFINKSNLPSELVEVDILNALNDIFAHDAKFTDIVCQLHEDEKWEIYLEENHKGRIALSQSGSGLKTVMSVLAYLILIPYIENKSLNQFLFGFEELENNIHPALLRRLNDYIYKSSVENDFTYFLTTHSNVLIDQFSKQSDAQIIHVIQKDSISLCTTARTYVENNGILDDLDVRASDILQANGIIWVEGPSDRIYLNRWIDLWSNGELREGTQYQVIFYGGRLLSHLSAENLKDVNSGISILNANRRAIILIDSDKKNQQTPINKTKERIRKEFESIDALCWVTKGKEIENYIPSQTVDKLLNISGSSQVVKYGSFFEHIDSISSGEGAKYLAKKALLAEEITQYMTKENLSKILDLNDRMNNLCQKIKSWNS